ncbi:hypothetical protein XBJ2_500017 [Xenorhabdus bovienii str. Jollieti]|uniref:Uncharacterized protein n=1 Tax=Xenorhabdus bovienii (strain SS-2004) TaxID=406818 RepID=D3V016_XENBS|nr:hypothetical protein [Xenorhabdus bovienii]CBJ80309.1 hypothetical protein XBJ1_1175 [Xenorhabdus bovienii SS-2004]CDH30042.1 hypothetical protein XBJ2_500017 [Xenorhabdus bovienii str. Jollieti]
MQIFAPSVSSRHYRNGVNIIEFPDGVKGMDCTMEERMNSGQWSMNELTDYLIDRDLMGSFMEELKKAQRRVA